MNISSLAGKVYHYLFKGFFPNRKLGSCTSEKMCQQLQIQDFPLGGGVSDPLGEGTDLRHRSFLAEMYVTMKELGPVGGGGMGRASGAPLDPPPVRTNSFHNLGILFSIIWGFEEFVMFH